MLTRFHNAQEGSVLGYDFQFPTYEQALQEIKSGYKKSHWIWYIFPQMQSLGKSELSKYYGIKDREEAYEYMQDPILSKRLIEACEAVYNKYFLLSLS